MLPCAGRGHPGHDHRPLEPSDPARPTVGLSPPSRTDAARVTGYHTMAKVVGRSRWPRRCDNTRRRPPRSADDVTDAVVGRVVRGVECTVGASEPDDGTTSCSSPSANSGSEAGGRRPLLVVPIRDDPTGGVRPRGRASRTSRRRRSCTEDGSPRRHYRRALTGAWGPDVSSPPA